ncbi:MAG: hypothetical protein AAB964_00535 [Patescibacteria group bacterium]
MVRTLFTIALFAAPALLHAQVYSTVEATANTGGNTAESGTVTTGNASASANVQTTSINGSSTVQIKTEANGQVYEETFSAPAGGVDVRVNATPAKTEVRVQSAQGRPAVGGKGESVLIYTATTSGTAATTPALPRRLLEGFMRVFSALFGFLF